MSNLLLTVKLTVGIPILMLIASSEYAGSDRGVGTGGGGQWGSCLHNSGTVEAVPPQLFIGLGTVWAVVVPNLGVVDHKGKCKKTLY